MRNFIKVFILIILTSITFQTFAETPALPANLIAYNSPVGEQLLKRSARHAFFQLSMEFLTQKNQAYCGVASISMVLNALSVQGPDDPVYAPYRPITQDNFFTSAVIQMINPQTVSHHGMTLDQAAEAVAQFQIHSKAIHSNTITLNKMRDILKSTLKNTKQYAILNFFRPGLQEKGGGHFSPVAAYDTASDRFLILDVARYKYPPIWVKAKDIWKAIDTSDNDSQKKRGILLIWKS